MRGPVDLPVEIHVEAGRFALDRQGIDHVQLDARRVPVVLVLDHADAVADAAKLQLEGPVADDVLRPRPVWRAMFFDRRLMDRIQRIERDEVGEERRAAGERHDELVTLGLHANRLFEIGQDVQALVELAQRLEPAASLTRQPSELPLGLWQSAVDWPVSSTT